MRVFQGAACGLVFLLVANNAASAAGFALLKGDAVRGKTVFAKCVACHAVEPGKNRIGPSLHGVVGHAAGKAAAFTYSRAIKAANITWTEAKLHEFLEHPMKTVPGTRMAFIGLSVAQDRADVIAYMKAN